MPQLDPLRMSLFMGIVGIIVQVLKTPLPDSVKEWIPAAACVLGMMIGLSLSLYYGLEPVAGLLEGLFGGASSVGAYELGNSVAPSIVTSRGWLPSSKD